MRTIYICTDSVTGIYSGIYDAWKQAVVNRQEGCGIALKGQVEQELFCEYTEVEEDLKKAAAVDRLIRKNMGEKARRDLYYALLTEDPEKGNAVLGTMFAARSLPDSRKIMEHLSHPMVEKVFELSRAAGGEAHNYKGFLRFRELENGVLYAAIRPKAQVLPCLAPHFADRLPKENCFRSPMPSGSMRGCGRASAGRSPLKKGAIRPVSFSICRSGTGLK